MKKTAFLLSVLMIAGLMLLQGSGIYKKTGYHAGDFAYPSAVKKVIDQKCYGCHSVKGKSDDAKKALMWDSVPNLSSAKQVKVLNGIIEVLEEGTMPPEDVVKKYPEAKLLDEEKRILLSWANAKADSILQ